MREKGPRDLAQEEVVELIESGYALTPDEIEAVEEKHGYKPETQLRTLFNYLNRGGFTQETGVEIKSTFEKGRILFYSGVIPEEQTDLEAAKKRVRKIVEEQEESRRIAEMARHTDPKIEVTTAELWQAQIDRLITLGFNRALYMSEDEYRASLPQFQPQPEGAKGKYPQALLVDPRISIRDHHKLLDMSVPYGMANLEKEFGIAVDSEPYQIWVQYGRSNRGMTADAFEEHRSGNERGLTIHEGFAFIREINIVDNDITVLTATNVDPRHVFHISGTRRYALSTNWAHRSHRNHIIPSRFEPQSDK